MSGWVCVAGPPPKKHAFDCPKIWRELQEEKEMKEDYETGRDPKDGEPEDEYEERPWRKEIYLKLTETNLRETRCEVLLH